MTIQPSPAEQSEVFLTPRAGLLPRSAVTGGRFGARLSSSTAGGLPSPVNAGRGRPLSDPATILRLSLAATKLASTRRETIPIRSIRSLSFRCVNTRTGRTDGLCRNQNKSFAREVS
jgi:hypothetical protein